MLKIYILFFALCFYLNGKGQQLVPFKRIELDKCINTLHPTLRVMIIDNDSLYKKLVSRPFYNCPIKNQPQNINFKDSVLVGFRYSCDCQASVNKEVIKNDSENLYKLRILIIDGGCRGLRFQEEWIILPRFNPNYKIYYEEVYKYNHRTRKTIVKVDYFDFL